MIVKYSVCLLLVAVFSNFALLHSPSSAATVTVAAYNLGENDPGAVAGGTGNNPTTAFVGTDAGRVGGPIYSANTPGGGSTFSMSFDDVDDYYTTGSPYVLPADNWGIEGWVYSTDAGNGGWAFSNGRYLIGQFSGNFKWHRNGLGDVANVAVAANEWHHMALVRDGGVLTAYFDGSAVSSTNQTDLWDWNFAIGARGDNGTELWAGQVDAVRLFTFAPGEFNPATDLGATLFATAPAVSEPATFVLAGIALTGLVVLRRLRQRTAGAI